MANYIIIAFDADDTLWDCQGHFERAEQELCRLLSPWATADEAASALFATEKKNMPLLGYGCKAFTLSVIETALAVSHNEISSSDISRLIGIGHDLLRFPTPPLPGVHTTLTELQRQGRRMVLFTKGELQDQENKLQRSGLAPFFDHVEITSDKTEREFRALCSHLGIGAGELLMVGNSFRSDIAPALSVGAWAVHIPFHVTWQLEHAEEFPHERLFRIERFEQILDIV